MTRVVISYSPVNGPEILDIPGRSFLDALKSKGLHAEIIPFNSATPAEKYSGWDDYLGMIDDAVGTDRPLLLGVCMGGTLALDYAKLHPKNIKSLILISTPVDLDIPVLNSLKYINEGLIEDNITAAMLYKVFNPSPFDRRKPYDVGNPVAKWAAESFKNVPEALIKDWIRLVKENKFKDYEIDVPVLNIVGSDDDVVPIESSMCNLDGYHMIRKSGHLVWLKYGEEIAQRIGDLR